MIVCWKSNACAMSKFVENCLQEQAKLAFLLSSKQRKEKVFPFRPKDGKERICVCLCVVWCNEGTLRCSNCDDLRKRKHIKMH